MLPRLGREVRRQRQLGELDRVERALEDARALLQHQRDDAEVLDAVRGAVRAVRGAGRGLRQQHVRPEGGEVLQRVAADRRPLAQLEEEVDEAVEHRDVRLRQLGDDVARGGDALGVRLEVDRAAQRVVHLVQHERVRQVAHVRRERRRRQPRVAAREPLDRRRRLGGEAVEQVVDRADRRVAAEELRRARAACCRYAISVCTGSGIGSAYTSSESGGDGCT